MGLEFRSSTIDASANAIGWVCPVDATGLVYANFFGGTATTTGRNLAAGDPVVVIGNPTESAKHTNFTPGANFVRTGALETAEKTLIAVVRATSEGKSRFIGTYRGDRPGNEAVLSNGVNLYFGLGTNTGDSKLTLVYDDAGWSGTPGSPSVAVPVQMNDSVTVGNWYCLVGRTTSSNVRHLINKTSATSATTGTVTAPDLSASPYEVGSTRGYTGFDGNVDLAFAAIFERALSDEEITTLYEFLQTYMATYSTPILI